MNGEWSMPELRNKVLETAGNISIKTTSSSKASSREQSVAPEDKKEDSNDVPESQSVKVVQPFRCLQSFAGSDSKKQFL